MIKVAPTHRVYDSKLPRKERSQTISSMRNIHGGSIKSLQFENKDRLQLKHNQPATSREARSKNQRVNLPPAPSTSRPKNTGDDEEENDAASEPDIKTKEWSNAKPVKQVVVKTDKKPNKACEIFRIIKMWKAKSNIWRQANNILREKKYDKKE